MNRNITKMVLIPEELFERLKGKTYASDTVASKRPAISEPKRVKRPIAPTVSESQQEDKPLEECAQRMSHIEANTNMPADLKTIHLQQEYQRLNALSKQRRERPIRVETVVSAATLAPKKTERSDLTPAEHNHIDSIMQYIADHRSVLPVSDNAQLRHRGLDVIDSNVRKNIEWELSGEKRRQLGAKPPPGHATFLKMTRKNTELEQMLNQRGEGKKKAYKKITAPSKFPFKPVLW